MKKTLLNLSVIASLIASAQFATGVNGHLTDVAAYDDFKDADVLYTPGVTEYSYETDKVDADSAHKKAYKGIYWTEATGTVNGFVANKFRDSANSKIVYTYTQTLNRYEPFLAVFGSYKEGATLQKFSLDLSDNATLSFKVKNLSDTATIKFTLQLQDINGASLAFLPSVVGDEDLYYNHNIGYSQGESDPLAPGDSAEFSFDFLTAVPANTTTNRPDQTVVFDYAHVTAVTFTAVNNNNTGNVSGTHDQPGDYNPLPLVNQKLEISNFRLGDQTKLAVVASINDEQIVNNFGNEVITVYNMTGSIIATGTVETLSLNSGFYILKSASKTQKVVIK